jgi:ABC-2 type transport system ATP-binding protein
VIEAEGLSRRFGAVLAVAEVSLRVPAGGVLALLGPNGAGKTTTVRMLAGLLAPSAGRASVAGYDVVRQAAQVRERVGLVTDVPGLYERMTLPDYLDFFGALYGLSRARRARRIDELLEFFELSGHRRERMGGFSKGMKQKVALARALLHEPVALFLDEPTSGLDPLSARSVRDLIGELKRSQRAIILCTHDLDEAERLADQIAIMRRGRIAALGTAATLRQRASPETLVRIELAQPVPGALAAVRQIPGVHDPREIADVRGSTEQASGADGAAEAALPRLEYRTTEPEAVNPRVLARLVALGAAVVSASNLTRTLEDVYADTMGLSRGSAEMGPDTTSLDGLTGDGAGMNGRRTDGGVNATETVHGSGRTPVVYDRERVDAATRAETPQSEPE